MYLPAAFQVENQKEIKRFITSHPFATLVTVADGEPFASHIPLLLEEADGLVLIGHMARANPQWKHFLEVDRMLAIFSGPHAYVSPSWYESPGVPTWNYASVHLYGRAQIIDSREELRLLIEKMTQHFESDASADKALDYPEKMLEAIVGFRIEVDEIKAKYKLSQNRSNADRENVANALLASDSGNERAVAELMLNRSGPIERE